MTEEISLRKANQHFARYVRAVEERGQAFVITRRGAPVARLVPVEEAATARRLTPAQQAARRRALERMRRGWDLGLGGGRLDRDALHERR